MANLSIGVGLLNCSVMKQFDRCVSLIVGHLAVPDDEPAEVWANFSAAGLSSLLYDLEHLEVKREGYEILDNAVCCVCGVETRCIQPLLGVTNEYVDGEPTGRVAPIRASLSERALRQLLTILETDPRRGFFDMAPHVETKQNTPYGWIAVEQNGNVQMQFPFGGDEQTFGVVDRPNLTVLMIEPKNLADPLPRYRLVEDGFYRSVRLESGLNWELLPLPVPDEPFRWRYCRRITVQVGVALGAGRANHTRIVQVLGWDVPRPTGDLVCELGVDEDGSWHIYRRGRLGPGTNEMLAAMSEEEFAAALAA